MSVRSRFYSVDRLYRTGRTVGTPQTTRGRGVEVVVKEKLWKVLIWGGPLSGRRERGFVTCVSSRQGRRGTLRSYGHYLLFTCSQVAWTPLYMSYGVKGFVFRCVVVTLSYKCDVHVFRRALHLRWVTVPRLSADDE